MNISDSPKALIRAGFFIGIGLGLAYAAIWAAFMTLFLVIRFSGEAIRWITGISPANPWAGPVLGLFILIGLACFGIYFLPTLREKLLILGNKRR